MKMLSSEKLGTLVSLFGLTFVVYGWFVFSLALGGLFFFPVIACGFVLLAIFSAFVLYRLLGRGPLELRIACLVALIYALTIGFFTEPTFFSGRDQGSIAEAAYRLAQNTELAFSLPGSEVFFAIYGEGTALNFPGFAYTEEGYLLTQFPLGYTAWIGSFVSLFGLTGFSIGNAILLFLSLFFLFELLRIFVRPYYAFMGMFLALLSFLPGWFAKQTLSENLALFLFLFLVFNIIHFYSQGKYLSYIGVLLSGGLLAFTRIEGFIFFAIALLALVVHPHTRSLIRLYPWKSIVLPAALFTFYLLRDFFLNLPYYKMIAKAFIKFIERADGSLTSGSEAASLGLGSVFFLYGLLALTLLGLFGILLILRRKRFILLFPALIALPTFLYLFQPNITPDHPWMLRRYLFSLFPTLLFSAVLGIALLFAKKNSPFPLEPPRGKQLVLTTFIFIGLFLLAYPAFSLQLPFAEHRGLREQIAQFSAQFSEKDLILVDQYATGDGFAMLTGPGQALFGKNTVYFFNPYDLSALDTSRFERVFLLTPEESQGRYAAVFGDRLLFQSMVSFSTEHFERLTLGGGLFRLPERETLTTQNLLFQIY